MYDNIVRFAVLALAILAAFAMLAVLRLHWLAYRRLPRGSGLLPAHVALVSASYSMLSAGIAMAVVDGLGTPVNWRIYLYGTAFGLVLTALTVVGKLQRRRLTTSRGRCIAVHTEQRVELADEPEAP